MAIKATVKFMNNQARPVYVNREFKDERHIDNFINYALTNWDNITVLDEVFYEKD
jgi:hypothetical protein|tara:strand:+ start:448 stop:612 length:165 start_codon:yes stop_codon:yes gene_type:complete